jgi:hypothetical protein
MSAPCFVPNVAIWRDPEHQQLKKKYDVTALNAVHTQMI